MHRNHTSRTRPGLVVAAIGAAGILCGAPAHAQEIDPYYADDYTFADLGSVPGVLTPYGGITFAPGDPDTLLIGGGANGSAGVIYSIGLERGCVGQIVGFVGEARVYATSPYIDGGLVHGPDDVLFYTTFPTNTIGQIKPGSTEADRIIDLGPLGVTSSTGTLMFVPEGFAGAGRLKIASYSGWTWYDSTVTPDGSGTFDIEDVTLVDTIGQGPEGIVYIPDVNPKFDADSVLVSEYGANRVSAFEIDGNGDAIAATQRTFMTGLSGAEGAAIDGETGDFLFSTFGTNNRVIIVRGFVIPCSADIAPPGGDGIVDFRDILAALAAWGEACVEEDINDDGIVDFTDILQILAQWGPCEE